MDGTRFRRESEFGKINPPSIFASIMLEQITNAVAAAIPGGLAEDVRNNVRAVLRSMFSEMDLVTREELEVQEAVLQRTREKVELLQRQVRTLEEKLLPDE